MPPCWCSLRRRARPGGCTDRSNASPSRCSGCALGTSAIAWREFDPDAIAKSLDSGHPAFVYFTADWCITCKVNEAGTLESGAVRDAVAELGVAVLEGDWTHRSTAIAEELARFGKAGVPMYLVYDPRKPQAPILLPELLTPGLVVDALRAAAPPRA